MKDYISGQYINHTYYNSFQPSLINRQWQIDDMQVMHLLSQADRELGRLDMYSNYIPNIDLFIRMHVLKEATQSSKIEGTQTNLDEALLDKEDIPVNKRDDWLEVRNYIKAMDWALNESERLPLSSRLICGIHKVLLQRVRGEHKQPGEFRKSQNWIGGASLDDAVFIPPVHTMIPELMSDLEKFIHNENIFVPELIKTGIIHYQFETIHPFLDGNGRVGRVLIPLYLVNKKILQQPILYLSDFFEKNRQLYYDNLMIVREKNDITQWLKFFLVGIIKTTRKGIFTFDSILQLQKDVETDIQNLGRKAGNAKKVLDYLYKVPVINAEMVSKTAEISLPSAYKLINDLEKLNIIREVTGAQRKKMYRFERYIKLFR